ncbi:MAG: M48 family metallopeptidase [Candidatus Omnitrophica bacterium]|nr:M48 family metallopeptidase [Candidatus Omnitrophota bacterium]
MNIYLLVVLSIIVVEYSISVVVDFLNIKAIKTTLPAEFSGIYNPKLYEISQKYLKENTYFEIVKESIFFVFTIIFIIFGGFNLVDKFARSFGYNEIITGLIFFISLGIIAQVMVFPFEIYQTFIIEQKYGFNKTTFKIFILDHIKIWILLISIGSIILSIIIWFFINIKSAWLYCLIVVTIFELFLLFIAPVVFLPLFNKFIPIEDGPLKNEIENFLNAQNFSIKGIFKIDASRRSTKTNAFFVGFGRFKKIALYDTLIKKHTIEELVSILAHEIGHYKKKHFLNGIIISILTNGFMFFLLSFVINNKKLFRAFGMQNISVYASLVFFAFLYRPINFFISIVCNFISRRNEYEADKFAVKEYKKPAAFVAALKKLAMDNFSNLTPHPLKVFFDYTHPPILKRIKHIQDYSKKFFVAENIV